MKLQELNIPKLLASVAAVIAVIAWITLIVCVAWMGLSLGIAYWKGGWP
jgi:hypothetical protein